jgi:serine/threonine protein kinase
MPQTLSLTTLPVDSSRLAQCIARITETLEAGEPVELRELCADCPECLEQLETLLPTLEAIVGLGHSAFDEIHDKPEAPSKAMSNRAGLLGDFRILRELGRGGMGVVYEAEQISIGRRVALKVLPFAAMLDHQQLNRFKNEARAAGTLDHPNIVAIHSVGCERGVHYYAMQLIEGCSLAEIISAMKPGRHPAPEEAATPAILTHPPAPATADTDKAALPTVRANGSAAFSSLPAFDSREYYRAIAKLGIQAAEALDHAHQNGILHRDIKPANLLVDEAGKLWITDFGLARIEQDAGMTMTGDLLGTLRYMCPEQALAKRAVVDHRSDIYSLGVTLYELLTLQPAFPGDDRQELLRQIAFDEPAKPRQLNPRIPQDLETIVLKAVEKNAADRYATAQELADDLQRFDYNRSIRARRPTLFQRARRLVGRHRIAATIIALFAFLSILIATAALADRRRQWEENNRFIESLLHAAQEALESNRVDEAIRRMTEAQTKIDDAQLVDPALAKDVAALKTETERYGKFMQLYKAARDDRSDEGVVIAPARAALALYRVMDNPHWLQELKDAGMPSAHIGRVSDAVYILLLQNADQLIRWSSHWPKATREVRLLSQCDDALELLKTAISFHQPSRGYYWLSANCAYIKGDKDKEKHLRAVALQTPVHDAAELFYINRDRLWGTASKGKGYPKFSFEENFKDHREMLRFDRTYYPAMFYMSYRLANEHRYAEALLGWYACTTMNPNDTTALFNRGGAHSRLGHFDEAKADYETALAIAPNNPKILCYFALVLATDPNEAMRDGKRAVELAQKACKLTDYKNPVVLEALAAAYAESGDFKSAVKWSEMAVELDKDSHTGWTSDYQYEKRLELFRHGKPWRDE